MTPSIDDQRAKLREYEKRLVSFFVKSGKIKKINSKFSTIFGYFYIRRRLTQTQLQNLTGFSAGTISQILNQLIAIRMVRRHNIPGSREKQYELIPLGLQIMGPTSNIMQELKGYIKGIEDFLDGIDGDLKRIKQRVNSLQEQGGSNVKDQLEKRAIPEGIQRIRAFIRDFALTIPVFERLTNIIEVEMRKIVS